MTGPTRLGEVLGAAVRIEGRPFGRVTAVVGDAAFERVIGLEVSAPAGGHACFLPWVAATFADGVVSASSRLVLFESREVESYVRRGATVAREPATLASLVAGPDGTLGGAGVSADLMAGTNAA